MHNNHKGHRGFPLPALIIVGAVAISIGIWRFSLSPGVELIVPADMSDENTKSWTITVPELPTGTCEADCREANGGAWSADFEICIQKCKGSAGDTIREVLKLVEIEDPSYDGLRECQKVLVEKYADEQCMLTIGPRKDLPMGSIRECVIKCRPMDAEDTLPTRPLPVEG